MGGGLLGWLKFKGIPEPVFLAQIMKPIWPLHPQQSSFHQLYSKKSDAMAVHLGKHPRQEDFLMAVYLSRHVISVLHISLSIHMQETSIVTQPLVG